jgi:hypothetical protein
VYGQRPGDNGHQGYWLRRQPPGVRSLPQCRLGHRDGARGPGRCGPGRCGPGRCGPERYEPRWHPAAVAGRRQPEWRHDWQRYAQRNEPRGAATRQYPQLIQLSRAEQRSYGWPAPQGPSHWPSHGPSHGPSHWSSHGPRRAPRAGWRPRSLSPVAAGGALLIAAVIATTWVIQHHAPPTCAQQYAAWRSGTGSSETAAMRADGSALSAARRARNTLAADTALKKMGADASADEYHPMPACADPAGFWPQVLSAMRAAGDNASVIPGLAGLVTAEAPLRPVAGIEAKLRAELERTASAGAT